ncbi:glycerophosphodiester phosphodiesterase [candidate division GN15 bacterium]|nr:glycerophosphodiester phosphodiesterase [candidate division GN15 bacterium]
MFSFRDMHERSGPCVIAHRGASEQAYENTLDAFERAIAIGADAVECDVRRAADGTIVVHHNPAVPGCNRPIAFQTYNEVQACAREVGFAVPTLAELLSLCAGRVALDIELKETGYEADIVAQVAGHFSFDHVVFKSFKDQSVARLHRLDPALIAGLLIGAPRTIALRAQVKEMAITRRLEQCGAAFVSPHWARLRLGFARKMRSLGLPMLVWTVDRAAMARMLIKKRVAGIISNVPDRILAITGRAS